MAGVQTRDSYLLEVRGNAEIARLEAGIRAAYQELERGGISLEQFNRRYGSAAQQVIDWNQRISQASGQSNATRGIIEISRAVDDLQYGLYGAINNVQQMFTVMGASGGAVAAITLLTVAINQAYKNWDAIASRVKEIFNDTTRIDFFKTSIEKTNTALEKTKKEIEDLSGTQVLLISEANQLADAKRRELELQKQLTEEQRKQANIASILTGKSLEQREREAAVLGTIQEAGGDATKKTFRDKIISQVMDDAGIGKLSEKWRKLEGDALYHLERPEIRRSWLWRDNFREIIKRVEKERTTKTNELNARGVKVADDLIDRLSRGDQKAISDIRNRIGDSDYLRDIEAAFFTKKTPSQRDQENTEAQKKIKEDKKQEDERIQGIDDQSFLDKARTGKPITDAERSKFLRTGTNGDRLRVAQLREAESDAQELTKKKSDDEAEKNQKSMIEEGVKTNKSALPNIAFAINRGMDSEQIFAKAKHDLKDQGITEEIIPDVAVELMRQAREMDDTRRAEAEAAGANANQARFIAGRDFQNQMAKAQQEQLPQFAGQTKELSDAWGKQLELDYAQGSTRGINPNRIRNNFISRAAQSGYTPQAAAQVADQSYQNVNREYAQQMANLGNVQAATGAVISRLISEINAEKAKSQKLLQELQQMGGRLQQSGPSFMPTFIN